MSHTRAGRSSHRLSQWLILSVTWIALSIPWSVATADCPYWDDLSLGPNESTDSGSGTYCARDTITLLDGYTVGSAGEVLLEEGIDEHETAQRKGDTFSLSRTGSLWTIRAEDAPLADILQEIAKISNVPFVLLDSVPEHARATLDEAGIPLDTLVAKIMSDQDHGGSAIYKDEQGMVTLVYIVTREGVARIEIQAREMFSRIDARDEIDADELFAWLRAFSRHGMALDPSPTGIAIGRVLWYLHEDFPRYRDHVLELFLDQSESSSLRYAMLELLSMHYEDPDIRNALFSVFDADPDTLLQSRVAWALAGKGEHGIGDTIVTRYPDSDSAARFRYAHALASLGRVDAFDLVAEDARSASDFGLRKNATEAAIQLAPEQAAALALLRQHVERASISEGENSLHSSQMERESIAMSALRAFSARGLTESAGELLAVAGDSHLTVNIRLTALEQLASTIQRTRFQIERPTSNEIEQLRLKIAESAFLRDVDKVRFNSRFQLLDQAVEATEANR